MPTKYITDDDREIVVDDDNRMLSKYGKPQNTEVEGLFFLEGYVPASAESFKHDELLSSFEPGCRLFFLNETKTRYYYSRRIKRMIEIPEE